VYVSLCPSQVACDVGMFVGDEGSAYSVLGVDEGVVDGDDIDVVVLDATVSLVSWSV
jgi:hypothetical protein